jgi:DNA-binding XRE family transcriptional regulator
MQLTNNKGKNLLDYLPTGWSDVHDLYKYITVDANGWVVAHKTRPVDGMSDSCYALHFQDKKGDKSCVWSRGRELYTIGDAVKAMRQHKRWTQSEFAFELGVTQSYVAQQEKGDGLGSFRFAKYAAQVCEIGLNISIKGEKVVFSLQPYY